MYYKIQHGFMAMANNKDQTNGGCEVECDVQRIF